MIEGYLLGRDELRMVAVLVDGEIGPTKLDVQLLDWLRTHDLPHTVIATKHDKVKSKARDEAQEGPGRWVRRRSRATCCGCARHKA